MVNLLIFIVALFVLGQAFIGLTFFITCIWEKEKRATLYAGLQLAGMLIIVIFFLYLYDTGYFHTGGGIIVLVAGLIAACGAAALLCRRTEPNQRAIRGTNGLIDGKVKRVDEREHVFARNRSLPPDSQQYRQFYEEHPDWEAADADRRKKGGPLGHPGKIDRPHEIPNVAATLASLNIPLFLSDPQKVKPRQHPHFKGEKIELRPEEATKRIKGYTLKLGADMVGITKINPLWIYSHRGEIFHENWEDWGKPIDIDHGYAIVFAEEMTLEMVGTGPHTPTVMESMRDYAKGAFISTQVASFIANLGYTATANHLRHYEALMVPLAVDAGLGEMGRLGYLMTQKFGPRVRLSVVTTDLPLIPDKPVDIGAQDFCKICKKCANCCPSKSIPVDTDQTVVNGIVRWKLNADTCFDYWGKVGTDCDICMRVCPWSHADTLPHRLIKFMVTRNKYARRFFYLLDDIFYGKQPRPKPAPEWAEYSPPNA
jgi:reductive dehalogenase